AVGAVHADGKQGLAAVYRRQINMGISFDDPEIAVASTVAAIAGDNADIVRRHPGPMQLGESAMRNSVVVELRHDDPGRHAFFRGSDWPPCNTALQIINQQPTGKE